MTPYHPTSSVRGEETREMLNEVMKLLREALERLSR